MAPALGIDKLENNLSGEEFSVELDRFGITDIYCMLNGSMNGDYVSPGMTAVPESLSEHVGKLSAMAVTQMEARGYPDEFGLRRDNEVFRCSRIKTVGGEILRFRRLPSEPPELGQLGIPPSTQKLLLDASFNTGGLLAVVGMPGQGKSTTCAATLVKRLKKFGGLCLTLEDPVEIPLQGRYEKGVCLQVEVTDDTSYADAIKKAMKSYPAKENSMLYVGEVRDGFAAKRMLDAANDGRLVLTTFHAKDIVSGLERIIALASSEISEGFAHHLLASSLRAIVFQTLENNQVKTKTLLNTLPVSGYLQSGKFKQVVSEMERQEKLLKQGVPVQEILSMTY